MLLDDIGSVLSAGGIGTLGTNLFLGFLPDKPDTCVAVIETGGITPHRAFRASAGQPVAERPSIQILCRAAAFDYATARNKAHDAYKLLEGYGDTTVNSTRYLWIGARQSPFSAGRDESNRPICSCNYEVVKELTA